MKANVVEKALSKLPFSFDLDEWLAKIGISNTLPVQAALCFGAGFAIGFLFKKHFKFLVGTLIVSLLLIKVFEYNQVLSVDWPGMKTLFGFEHHASANAIINEIFDWIKDNMIIFISSITGFLLGNRLG